MSARAPVCRLFAGLVCAALSPLRLAAAASPPPVPVLSIDTNQSGMRLQVNFPPEAGADPNRLLYLVDHATDISLDVQVFAGRDEVGFPIALDAALLLDGQQVTFRLNEGRPARTAGLTLSVPGVVTHANLFLASSGLSPGVHTVDLLLWRADGIPFPCWSFLLVKGASLPPTSRRSVAFVVADNGRRPAADFWLSSDLRPLFGPLRRVESTALQRLGVRAHLERSARDHTPLELAVAALLDGEQVAFARSGRSPAVTLEPGQSADVELTLGELPRASSGHQVRFFLLRRPVFAALDGFLDAEFFPTRQVGGVKW